MVPIVWNPVVGFVSSFMTVFATVIAFTKDLPDVAGDIEYNISTFASKFGVKKIAGLATGMLCCAYGTAMALPFCTARSRSFHTGPNGDWTCSRCLLQPQDFPAPSGYRRPQNDQYQGVLPIYMESFLF